MEQFLQGVLEKNKEGATYEGVVYDRWLDLRLTNNDVVSIFDPGRPMSGELLIGQPYEMIVVIAVPREFRIYLASPSSTKPKGSWRGTVLNTRWRAQATTYRKAREKIFEHTWILLSLPMGGMLMHPRNVRTSLHPGDILEWEDARLDLYAVL